MGTSSFAKFVESQQEVDLNTRVDWAKIREDWLSDLDKLYSQAKYFLQEYVAAGSIRYSFTEIELTENPFGTYQVQRMEIYIGRQKVFLEPIGALMIGCRGRVDAMGSAGSAQLLLVNEKAKSASDLISVTVTVAGGAKAPVRPPATSWSWKIVTKTPQRQFVPLDKESFFSLLMEIANG